MVSSKKTLKSGIRIKEFSTGDKPKACAAFCLFVYHKHNPLTHAKLRGAVVPSAAVRSPAVGILQVSRAASS